MIWDEFLRHFRFCDEEDSGLSDKEQERKGPKNRPKHTRKRIHQAKKNFLEKFKTASKEEKVKENHKLLNSFIRQFPIRGTFFPRLSSIPLLGIYFSISLFTAFSSVFSGSGR
ncbi:hypothetical protein [Bacteroides sp. An19]|uniref:hypothetical protein n=1 Tax=Bacteroides sp. An19 TaxID=1965580 RepID=UPI0013A6170E|nr:hypothetical protein [Bacteroides sp. An19]